MRQHRKALDFLPSLLLKHRIVYRLDSCCLALRNMKCAPHGEKLQRHYKQRKNYLLEDEQVLG